ncbi:Fur family transcriptional regulator, peroxide stress response regulator [Anaerovirgula multivorans]|uniref:Fur family transcriptional regulator, peroxide stress response regulator n=1 Tax=Anaerovirgula multivorans TaxID=312168 RepID=A0A239H625_9FIRM|nr:Fur family transcriptional regulator [Anaerovirgula multivorans]SNS76847.1 Fur family transcriptional regulator, peroxide stress response regulator [Anaerovirgula multivorans]
MDTLIKLLKNHNCKITPQRIAIYHAVRENHDHPNAEAIYKMLAPTYPTISLATVYKSLELFASLGLVKVINIGENSFRYDFNTTSHPHVVCTVCQRVEDLDNEFFAHLPKRVESLTNYKISNQQLCFYGTCSKCAS